jgi:hypothetical protein
MSHHLDTPLAAQTGQLYLADTTVDLIVLEISQRKGNQ